MKTFNTRLVVKTLGALVLIESVFLGLSAAVGYHFGDPDREAFLLSTAIATAIGLGGLLFGRNATPHVSEREGYVIVAFVWVVCSAVGLLPYYLSGSIPTLTDAWFETMSGFTTTGATCLSDVEVLSHAAHIWRSLMQWLGGMGIIVLSIAIMPMFGLGGMQLYAAEMNGLSYEKLSPKIADTAKVLWASYIIMTVVCTIVLMFEEMPVFDSICHGLTTIATGGFSTKNASIGYYENPAIHYTVAIGMLVSGLNYGLLILAARGKFGRLFRDEETQWVLGAVAILTTLITAGLYLSGPMGTSHLEESFRQAFFTVVATITSSGFAIADYMTWPVILWVLIFFVMFTGASSGSTSGGLKWVRLMIFAKSGMAEMSRRIHPNAIIPVKLNGKPVTQQTTNNVMAFFVFYLLILIAGTLVFCATGINFDESLSTAVSALGNVGPSIGKFGPASNYADFPAVGKWVMTVLMLIGRLEIFTILLLFTRVLWKK